MDTLDQLAEQYAAALGDYLVKGGETPLRLAYELGRKAIASGVGVLEMASIHNKSLTTIFTNNISREQSVQMAERASAFFAESLSSFEMVLRGFRETNEFLNRQYRELVEAQQSLESERRRYQELFNFAPDSYLATGVDGTIQEANNAAADLLKVRQDLLVGQPFSSFVTEVERPFFHNQLARLQKGELEKIEFWPITIQRSPTESIPVSLTVGIVRDLQGNPIGLRCLLRDITERKRLEEERAQLLIREHLARAETEAAQRLKFLAEVSTALAGSLDYASIPDLIALLSVPYFADYCFVYLTDEFMVVRHFAAAHSDPEKAELVKSLQFSLAPMEVPSTVAEVLRKGKPEIFSELSETWLETFACGRENFELLRKMNFRSALLVPLIARGFPLGAITFMASESGRQYAADDLALADELARRCALFLENARLYHQVIVERDKAEKASQAKEEFVAVLSHELRTPLMTILGWARILGRQPQIMGDQVLSDGVQSLEHNAQTITRLVEDCLDIARISEGKFQLQKEAVDLNQVTNTAFESIRERAYVKGLKLGTQFLASSLYVAGDKTRLEQVLLNLLTNAIKYTEDGGEVSIGLRRIDNEAEIEVKDTGIGIDPEFKERIFEPFGQGTRNWFESDSGLGLGLAIARDIVHMHGGRIWVESPGRGCGSTFRLRLPLAPIPEQQKNVEQPSPLLSGIKPLRILFVEDSKDVLNLLRIELEELGYSVFTAADGETGLAIAERELPDVIVSDIKMPRFDGYELIKKLRQIPQLAAVPAIALSGFGMSKDVEKALKAGYNAHLCKPVELNELVATIQKFTSSEPHLPSA
ncbi:MAG: response regulator [Acidobacteria bacterium]|nr:response regulator [Acidobacteriota bacterium]